MIMRSDMLIVMHYFCPEVYTINILLKCTLKNCFKCTLHCRLLMPSVVPSHHSWRLLTYITIEQQALGYNLFYVHIYVYACVCLSSSCLPHLYLLKWLKEKKELCHVQNLLFVNNSTIREWICYRYSLFQEF